MKSAHLYLLLYVVFTNKLLVNTDFVTAGVVLGAGGISAYLYPSIYSYFYESCDSNWIRFNAAALKSNLDNWVFGQHIASRIVLRAVTAFMTDSNPKKSLVLSMHGPTGTGKNLISQLIVKNIYRKGTKSSFVHLFTATDNFPHKSQIETYKSQLKQWIRGNVSNCEHSMFIFDEVDKMPPGLVDSIKPYLDYYDKLGGVSYRRAIFIFLSNAGGHIITETALQFWKDGRNRWEIELKDLEVPLSRKVFNFKESGMFHTNLIETNLVDFFIPFLPLEHRHVVQCALAEMKARKLVPNLNVAKKMADDFVYYPKTERVFSSIGCKLIQSKIHYYM